MGAQSKCSVCDEPLVTQDDQKNHSKLHDPSDRVVCRGCGFESRTLKRYLLHARRCFPCHNCERVFTCEAKRDEHLCAFPNGQLVCACGETFMRYIDVVEHARGPKPLHCCVCPRTSLSFETHIKHLRKHSKQPSFQCSRCDKSFQSADLLSNHKCKDVEEEEEDDGGFDDPLPSPPMVSSQTDTVERKQCPECGKMFRANRLEGHLARHNRSPCLCPECGKMFDSQCRLSYHLQTTHYSEAVTCDVCQKVLKTKKILTEHLKTHLKTETGTRVAQAVCPMCGLELAQKGSLARHILLVHERHKLKKDDVPRACRECGNVLPNAAQYYSHRRQHRAAKERYICGICTRVFNKKQNLLRHVYLLHDQNRVIDKPEFSCSYCCRMFRERRNLLRHLRLVHKIDDHFS